MNVALLTPDTSERRGLPDRRARPTPAWSRYSLRGRRRGGRRGAEATNAYADRYTLAECAPVLLLLGLGVVDWGWTLMHLARGVEEANPWLRWVWEAGGTPAFSAAKLGIACGAGAFLLMHVRFRWVRRLLPVALVVYTAVLGVHFATELAHGMR